MAQDYRTFACTIPANTPIATPFTVAMVFPPRIVDRVEFVIPPGPSGVMGFALAAGGQVVIPYASNTWIIADATTIAIDLDDYITSGSWALVGYNTGQFPHTVQVRFHLSLPHPPPAPPLSFISPARLSGTLH